jgi:predicted CXXCH cytochrome family protein
MKKLLIALLVVVALSLLMTVAVWAQVPEDSVLSGEQCKMCHAEQHGEWAGTKHPNSLTAVIDSGHGSEDCLHCMSADYRWDNSLTIETAKYGVTCVACHTPHDTPGDNKPAIADVAALCKDCHNAELEPGATAEAGTALRHAVTEMFGGYGAIDAEGSVSKHDMACNTCHLQGHLYVPEQSTCDGCHGGNVKIEDAGAAVRAKVEAVMAMEGLAESYPAAYTNVTLLSSDDSGGIHNMPYANAIVAAIDLQLAQEPAPAPTAAPTEEAPAEEAPAEEAAPPAEMPTSGGAPLVSGSALLMLTGTLSVMGGLVAYAWNRRK